MKTRNVVSVTIVASLCMLAAVARGQYQAIPNYTGIGAGASFRDDINNHLAGVTPIAPRLVGLPFAQLPTEQDGQLYWCQDCQQSLPCSAGGTGAMALGAHGQWACEAGSGSGSPVGAAGNDLSGSYPNPIVNSVLNGKTPVTTQNGINSLASATGSYNMNANKLQGLAADTASGDALSRGQSTINSLGLPTSSYSMNGQTLTGLPAAAAAGQPIEYGQSGAQLAGLSLNGLQLSNLGSASASGQAIVYGQSGAQLAASQMPTLVSTATAQHSGTSLTIPRPLA